MSAAVLYNVPLSHAAAYAGQRLIVRTTDPAALVAAFPDPLPEQLACVQLLGLPADIGPLIHWGVSLPLDIVLTDPSDYPQLYRYPALHDNHPLRVTLPAAQGIWPAVKLASALHFAVKIELGQPTAAQLAELHQVLDHLLHHSASQPIEPFYSLLLAFFRQTPLTLWTLQEQERQDFCYISDSGTPVTLPAHDQSPDACHTCPFWAYCGGYLRWPDPAYDCSKVIPLLQTVQAAAAELRHDLDLAGAAHS